MRFVPSPALRMIRNGHVCLKRQQPLSAVSEMQWATPIHKVPDLRRTLTQADIAQGYVLAETYRSRGFSRVSLPTTAQVGDLWPMDRDEKDRPMDVEEALSLAIDALEERAEYAEIADVLHSHSDGRAERYRLAVRTLETLKPRQPA